MKRGGPLKPRSAKMAAVYELRRPLVAELTARGRRCQFTGGCTNQATEVHEILTRARSGNTSKAILDRANCLALCHESHRWVTANSGVDGLAERLGMVVPGWVGYEGLHIAEQIRQNGFRADPPPAPWRTDPEWRTTAIPDQRRLCRTPVEG